MATDARPCYIIAEAGVNHNGSVELAHQLVDAAADVGADAVKFQTFRADRLASAAAPKAAYQSRQTGQAQSQLEMLRALELSPEAHGQLQAHCRQRGIEFLSSPFDEESMNFLLELGVARLKLGSGEITNGPLLLQAARSGLPFILSTGMSTLGEVEDALALLAFGMTQAGVPQGQTALRRAWADPQARQAVAAKVTILHCTTEYPAPGDQVNLRAMQTMAAAFGLPCGYSDHTEGIAVSLAAVALGARIIEKHFTLDRNLPGPDHRASIEAPVFRTLVEGIREVEAALGDGAKVPVPVEFSNMLVARKSLMAARDIKAGEILSAADVSIKRPGGGPSPMNYWSLLGQAARRDYRKDEFLD